MTRGRKLHEPGVVVDGTADERNDARFAVCILSVLQHQLRVTRSTDAYLSHGQSSVKIALPLPLQLLRRRSEFVALARQRRLHRDAIDEA